MATPNTMEAESKPQESFIRKLSRRMSKGLKKSFSRMVREGARIRQLRFRLLVLLLLPSVVSLAICWAAGEDLEQTATLLAQLATISCLFSSFYDCLSQFTEAVYRWKEQDEAVKRQTTFMGFFCARYNVWRTVRYGGVHFVYNGPYHTPKLLFLNWMYPGSPDATIAWHKWLWATFVFSPGESFGVLTGIQIMRDGGNLDKVCAKLYSDGLQFQTTKWIGHAIPHYLSFLASNDVLHMYVYNFGFKAVFEIVLSFIAARPVKNKSGVVEEEDLTAYTHLPDPLSEQKTDEEDPLKKSQPSNYGSV